jgi:hypothetical protein
MLLITASPSPRANALYEKTPPAFDLADFEARVTLQNVFWQNQPTKVGNEIKKDFLAFFLT